MTLAGAGCQTGRWAEITDTEDVDELRRFIQERPDDLEASDALRRIAELEFQQATRLGNRYAFAMFLERHPESSRAVDARRQLERLDLEAAQAEGTAGALQAFLRAHPRSRLVDKAHAALEQILCQGALERAEQAELTRLLSERPDLACRGELQTLLRALRLRVALESEPLRPMLEFLDAYPDDPDLRQVRARLLGRLLDEWLRAGLFERAAERVQAEAGVGQAEAFLARIVAAQEAWRMASFQDAPSARDPARARILRRLAEAVRRLRTPVERAPISAGFDTDPRQRWLWLDGLGRQPDEAHAERLLQSLGDPYLEVRATALGALRELVPLLGALRSEAWLVQTRAALVRSAVSGPRLVQLAVVQWLMGDLQAAAASLSRVLAEENPPDLFALGLTQELALERRAEADAAGLARRLSLAARDFGQRRREAWGQQDEFRGSTEGFLILRQLHGLLRLWERALAPFRAGRPAFESSQGPWLERAEADLRELATWHADEEERFRRARPGYQPSFAPAPGASAELAPRLAALVELTFLGGQRASPNLDWAACCATPAELRLQAAVWQVGLELARLAAPPAWAL